VLTSGHPVPAVVRSSPFVLGAVKRPRHPADAAGLIRALMADGDRPASLS